MNVRAGAFYDEARDDHEGGGEPKLRQKRTGESTDNMPKAAFGLPALESVDGKGGGHLDTVRV